MDFLHWWIVSCRNCTGPTQSSPFVWVRWDGEITTVRGVEVSHWKQDPRLFATEIWMNYDDLTVTVTFILVSNGNHPQRTINNLFSAIFRSENCVSSNWYPPWYRSIVTWGSLLQASWQARAARLVIFVWFLDLGIGLFELWMGYPLVNFHMENLYF